MKAIGWLIGILLLVVVGLFVMGFDEDTLYGHEGNDTMRGGDGDDQFVGVIVVNPAEAVQHPLIKGRVAFRAGYDVPALLLAYREVDRVVLRGLHSQQPAFPFA